MEGPQDHEFSDEKCVVSTIRNGDKVQVQYIHNQESTKSSKRFFRIDGPDGNLLWEGELYPTQRLHLNQDIDAGEDYTLNIANREAGTFQHPDFQ